MGPAFVLFFLFIVLTFLTAIVTGIALLITYFFGGKNNRARKMLAALILPGLGIFTFFGSLGIGGAIVQVSHGFDVGFGDFLEAPLPNGYSFYSVDIPEKGNIGNGHGNGVYIAEISDIKQLQESGEKVFGICEDDNGSETYFLFDTKSGQVADFPTREALASTLPGTPLDLVPVDRFYIEKCVAILGLWFQVVFIGSIVLTLGVLFAAWKLIFRRGKTVPCNITREPV